MLTSATKQKQWLLWHMSRVGLGGPRHIVEKHLTSKEQNNDRFNLKILIDFFKSMLI